MLQIIIIIIIIIIRLLTHDESFTKWRIASAGSVTDQQPDYTVLF